MFGSNGNWQVDEESQLIRLAPTDQIRDTTMIAA